MRTFQIVKNWARPLLDDAGYQKVRQHPGPYLPDEPDRYVLWTRYGGPGEDLEGVLDDISWQVRVVGLQNDYNSAEELADFVDLQLLNIRPSHIGGVWVTRVQRVGGAPNALESDEAERTHFVCSYIIGTEMALVN